MKSNITFQVSVCFTYLYCSSIDNIDAWKVLIFLIFEKRGYLKSILAWKILILRKWWCLGKYQYLSSMKSINTFPSIKSINRFQLSKISKFFKYQSVNTFLSIETSLWLWILRFLIWFSNPSGVHVWNFYFELIKCLIGEKWLYVFFRKKNLSYFQSFKGPSSTFLVKFGHFSCIMSPRICAKYRYFYILRRIFVEHKSLRYVWMWSLDLFRKILNYF